MVPWSICFDYSRIVQTEKLVEKRNLFLTILDVGKCVIKELCVASGPHQWEKPVKEQEGGSRGKLQSRIPFYSKAISS